MPTRGWARLPLQRSAACFKEHALLSLAPPPHTHAISSKRVRLEKSSTPQGTWTFERPATRSGSSRAPFAPIAASVCSCYETTIGWRSTCRICNKADPVLVELDPSFPSLWVHISEGCCVCVCVCVCAFIYIYIYITNTVKADGSRAVRVGADTD